SRMGPEVRRAPSACRDCGWQEPASCARFFSSKIPDTGLRELDRVTGRVADVDRTATRRPLEVGLDLHALGFQFRTPALDLFGARGKAEMPRSPRTMCRDRQLRILIWHRCGVGVEQQQNALTAAEEHMASFRLQNDLKAKHITVEPLRRIQVLHIEPGFKYCPWLHRCFFS